MNLEKTQDTISNVATTETAPVFKGEDVEQQDGGLSPEELKFLKEFPMMKAELEAVIKKQRAIADDIDKTHKKFTQTNLVTDSIAVVSGTMSILGLALAPVTAGGSLMLSAAGQGLGAVAGATSLATSILEYRHNKQAQAQVSREVSDSDQKVKEAVNRIMGAGKTVYCFGKTIENIENNMRALELVRAYPLLAEAAEQLLLTGQASARTTRIVRRAFRGTPLAMGTKALLKHGALAGLFLGMDMSSLEKDWKQLKEGARTEEADQLRAQAEEWERKLAELTQLYEHLQELIFQGRGSRYDSVSAPSQARGSRPPGHSNRSNRWIRSFVCAQKDWNLLHQIPSGRERPCSPQDYPPDPHPCSRPPSDLLQNCVHLPAFPAHLPYTTLLAAVLKAVHCH
ncbi:apolipoprotein L6 isoform X2 [Pipistrellus kuhlii]|uniref:apolipoprotein L6 isoform X2 n=1 Tax=Pipistrellus kuhlii TaxID=59472 RepID=UPI001E271D25|nr:apolipoprotein L6 isoform X2 [Pipistrellus kuhlii]